MTDWSPELALNNDLLDAQHVDLFRKIAAAAEALDGSRAQVEAAVSALDDALVEHLSAEERLMNEALYPERTRHRSAHELFMADFQQMRDELRRNGATPVVADWLQRRIPEWLRFHTRVNDLPFGEFLARRRGQSGAGGRAQKDGPSRLS